LTSVDPGLSYVLRAAAGPVSSCGCRVDPHDTAFANAKLRTPSAVSLAAALQASRTPSRKALHSVALPIAESDEIVAWFPEQANASGSLVESTTEVMNAVSADQKIDCLFAVRYF